MWTGLNSGNCRRTQTRCRSVKSGLKSVMFPVGYNYHTIIGNVLIESFTLTSDLDRNEISLLVVLLTACPSSVKKRHICFSLADYKVRACHVSFFTDYKVRACLVSLWLTTR